MHGMTATLTRIGAQLGQGQIKQRPNDGEVEWRGTVYDLPARLKVDSVNSVEGTVKFANRLGTTPPPGPVWQTETRTRQRGGGAHAAAPERTRSSRAS
jgi:hypothetical protein